jgi:hypothetical protein
MNIFKRKEMIVLKKIFLLMSILVFAVTSIVYAAVPNTTKPNVVVMYLNNAKTKFNGDVDQSILSNLAKCITADKYEYIDGKPYIEKLNKVGIVDISTAERSDIVDSLEGENIDYVVFVEVQPFVRKEKVHFFNYGIEMTSQVPFKIIDVVNNKYLYNGKFVEQGDKSTSLGGLGNKGVVLKALDKVNEQIAVTLETRLPATKPSKSVK